MTFDFFEERGTRESLAFQKSFDGVVKEIVFAERIGVFEENIFGHRRERVVEESSSRLPDMKIGFDIIKRMNLRSPHKAKEGLGTTYKRFCHLVTTEYQSFVYDANQKPFTRGNSKPFLQRKKNPCENAWISG
jgi:hypothetical protein